MTVATTRGPAVVVATRGAVMANERWHGCLLQADKKRQWRRQQARNCKDSGRRRETTAVNYGGLWRLQWLAMAADDDGTQELGAEDGRQGTRLVANKDSIQH